MEGLNSVELKDGCSLELLEEVDEDCGFVEDPFAVAINVLDMSRVCNYNWKTIQRKNLDLIDFVFKRPPIRIASVQSRVHLPSQLQQQSHEAQE